MQHKSFVTYKGESSYERQQNVKNHHPDHRNFNCIIRHLYSCKTNENLSLYRLDPGNPSVNGIELVALSLSKEKKEIGACILGVLEGLAGLVLLFSGIQRFITDVMAAYMVGAVILIYGIFQIVGGIKTYSTSKGKGILSIICGILSVIVSIVSFTHPVLTMISAGYMIAFSVLMQGINMIVLGINFGKAES